MSSDPDKRSRSPAEIGAGGNPWRDTSLLTEPNAEEAGRRRHQELITLIHQLRREFSGLLERLIAEARRLR
jgi:hypothetical protein